MKEKVTKPDIVIALTDDQIIRVNRLHNKQQMLKSGMIFGSLSLDGKHISLSYHPQHIGEMIRDLVYDQMKEKKDVNSKETGIQ